MGKFKKLLIMLVSGVLVLVLAFVGTLIYLQSHAEDGKKKETSEKDVKHVVYKIEDPIVSNIKDDKKTNIRVQVELVLRDSTKQDKTFYEEFANNEGKATTVIIALLRSKTSPEVMDAQAPIRIGKDITGALNRAFDTDIFLSTEFKEFITQ